MQHKRTHRSSHSTSVHPGLGVAGRSGVEHALRCLLGDLDLTMAMAGIGTVEEIDARVLTTN